MDCLAIVTGASRGVGRVIAIRLARDFSAVARTQETGSPTTLHRRFSIRTWQPVDAGTALRVDGGETKALSAARALHKFRQKDLSSC